MLFVYFNFIYAIYLFLPRSNVPALMARRKAMDLIEILTIAKKKNKQLRIIVLIIVALIFDL